MDALELLRRDHRRVRRLFERLEDDSGEAMVRAQRFQTLKRELEIHRLMEEALLYPMLHDRDETGALIEEALQEHENVQRLLDEMTALATGSEAWRTLLDELRANVEYHVEAEETELFEQASHMLPADRRAGLGEQLEVFRQSLARR